MKGRKHERHRFLRGVRVSTAADRAEYAASLRAIADLLDENEHVPLPGGATFNIVLDTAEQLADARRRIGGQWEKNADGDFFWLKRDVGPHEFNLFAYRSAVCERVVTGTEQVEVPDPAAPLVTIVRDVVEWVCSPLLTDAVPA